MNKNNELEKEERTIFIVLSIIVMIAIGVLVTWYFTKDKKEETEETPKCNHSSSNWFNSEKEAIATYDKKVKEWGDKWSNGIISYEQYIKNCPSGYETWDCPICHKWTINMYSKN